jgi:hypothetical protein
MTRWTEVWSPRNTGQPGCDSARRLTNRRRESPWISSSPRRSRTSVPTTTGGQIDLGWDENATEEDIARLSLEQDSDPRAGRLLAEDEAAYDTDEAYLVGHDDRLARDEGIDGGGASAEEAAIRYRIDES